MLKMTCQSDRQHENRQRPQEKPRKRFRSPFTLFRDRSQSRDRSEALRQDDQQTDSLKHTERTDRHCRRKTV